LEDITDISIDIQIHPELRSGQSFWMGVEQVEDRLA